MEDPARSDFSDPRGRMGRSVDPALEDRVAALESRIEDLSFNLRMMDRALDAVALAHRVEPPTPQDYPANASITPEMVEDDAPGFHQLQRDSRGRAYRWTGPETDFHFIVAVDRSAPRLVRLTYARSVDPAVLHTTRLFVDARETPLRRGRDGLEAVLPQLDATMHPTHLAFLVERTVSPSELPDAGSDRRKLGISFYSLDIE